MYWNIKLLTEDGRLPVTLSYIGAEQFPALEYVHLCGELPQRVSVVNRAFLGSFNQIHALYNTLSEEDFSVCPVFFIIPDVAYTKGEPGVEKFIEGIKDKHCNILYVNLDRLETLNIVHEIIGNYRYWYETFEQMKGEKTQLQDIIDAGHRMLKCPVILLNMGYSVVAGQGLTAPVYDGSDELVYKGFLTINTVTRLRYSEQAVFQPIRQGVSTIAFLLLYKENEIHYMEGYLALLVDALKHHLHHSATGAMNRRVEFEQLVYDFIEMNIQSTEEIHQRMQMMDLQIKKYYCCMVVKFVKEEGRPLNPYIPQVKRFFPNASFAMYSRSIVALIPTEHRENNDLCPEGFAAFLEKDGLMAGFSSAGRSIEYFRTFYIMAHQALRLGERLGHEDETNTSAIYFFEDYRMYHMIDLCHEAFVRMYRHDNSMFLCHPVLVELSNYDEQNGTNLVALLYTYLKLNGNLSQTARVMHFHRNTVMNKIDKIEELTGISLADSHWQTVLMFSCMVYQYMQEFLNEDFSDCRMKKKTMTKEVNKEHRKHK